MEGFVVGKMNEMKITFVITLFKVISCFIFSTTCAFLFHLLSLTAFYSFVMAIMVICPPLYGIMLAFEGCNELKDNINSIQFYLLDRSEQGLQRVLDTDRGQRIDEFQRIFSFYKTPLLYTHQMMIEEIKAEYRFKEIDEALKDLGGCWSYDENGIPAMYLDEMVSTKDMKAIIELKHSFPLLEPNTQLVKEDDSVDMVLYLYWNPPKFEILVADSDLIPEKSYQGSRYSMMQEKRSLLKKGGKST